MRPCLRDRGSKPNPALIVTSATEKEKTSRTPPPQRTRTTSFAGPLGNGFTSHIGERTPDIAASSTLRPKTQPARSGLCAKTWRACADAQLGPAVSSPSHWSTYSVRCMSTIRQTGANGVGARPVVECHAAYCTYVGGTPARCRRQGPMPLHCPPLPCYRYIQYGGPLRGLQRYDHLRRLVEDRGFLCGICRTSRSAKYKYCLQSQRSAFSRTSPADITVAW